MRIALRSKKREFVSDNNLSQIQKICDGIENLKAHQQRSRIADSRWIGK